MPSRPLKRRQERGASMKQRTTAWILLGVLLLASCAKKAQPEAARLGGALAGAAEANDVSENAASSAGKAALTLRALIVDGAETGNLILAGERGVYDVYTLDASGVPVMLDGAPAEASALRDGMRVELTLGAESGVLTPTGVAAVTPAALDGAVESVAAYSLGTRECPGGTTYDLCGLYLQVLNDLWEKDAGLNGGAKYASVDLSAAPGGLSEAEQFAVAWAFARAHGVEALTLTYDELIEQGYLSDAAPKGAEWEAYQWADGVLLRITADEWAEGETYSLPVVKFSAEKWRSPLGAYFLAHCTAVWSELGTWESYSVGAEAIA